MRNNILYVAITFLALMVSSCKEEGDFAEGDYKPSLKAYYLNAGDKEFSKTANAQTWATPVYAGDNSWQFNGYADWIQISPNSGSGVQNVDFSIAANPSGTNTRTSIFDLLSAESDWKYNTHMSISQQAAEQKVYLKENSSDILNLGLAGMAGSKDVYLETNCVPTVSVSNNSSNWLTATYSEQEKKVHIEVKENTLAQRSGTITVRTPKNSNSYVTINVVQYMANLSVTDKTQLVFENTAGTYELEINSEAAWTVHNDLAWITTSPSTGGAAGVSKLIVMASPNTSTSERTGSFYLYIGTTKVVEVKVTQRGIYVDAGGDVYNLTSFSSISEFEVNSNVGWTVESTSDWLIVNPTQGATGKTQVKATIADNPSVQGRLGWLTFTSEGQEVQVKKRFFQNGKDFDINTKEVSFDDKASTQEVEVTSDGSWTATKREKYSWFSISPDSAESSGKLEITVLENNTIEDRIGYVDITTYDKTEQITVHQASKYFTVNFDKLELTSLPTTSLVEISTNDAWKTSIENNATWLTLSPSEGEGDCKMTVAVADNPSTKSRAAYVDVTSTNTGQVVRLNYQQAARFLRASCADFTFFAKGGTSEVVNISSDAQFDISQEGSWFSVDKVDDYTFTVTATENNTNAERTGKIFIKATDLKEGELSIELPLRQLDKNSNFTKGEFASDESWDLIHGSDATIKVVKFTADKSWDVNTKSNGQISFSGYGEDSNWDVIKKSNTTITGNGYSKDGDWNANNGSTGNIKGNDYGKDGHWNANNGSTGVINGNSYGKDGDWNTNNSSIGNISGKDYGNDKDWNNNK